MSGLLYSVCCLLAITISAQGYPWKLSWSNCGESWKELNFKSILLTFNKLKAYTSHIQHKSSFCGLSEDLCWQLVMWKVCFVDWNNHLVSVLFKPLPLLQSCSFRIHWNVFYYYLYTHTLTINFTSHLGYSSDVLAVTMEPHPRIGYSHVTFIGSLGTTIVEMNMLPA